jgi:nitrogen fixation protein FixH
MTNTDPPTSRSGAVWAWVPALLLGTMLLGLGTLAVIATDDPHFALEPNYYDKAVHWDRTQRERRDSAALGLELTLTKALAQAADGTIEIELRVESRERAPLQSAAIELEAFPNAYASRIERVKLLETAPGVYRARLKGQARGLWELRFDIVKGPLRFQQSLRRDVGKGDAA